MAIELKVAIVGCGQIADAHISEIQKLGNANVVALCDLEILMAEQAAIRYKVPQVYSNFKKMLLSEKPDVVHITTPPSSHLTLAETALNFGCHIYVEKPLTPSYEDAVILLDYATQKNKKLTIGWNSYFDPPNTELRQLVNEGVIGAPIHTESFFGYGLANSFGKAILGSNKHWVHSLPGKLFQNNIDHMLNKVVDYIDDENLSIKVYSWKNREETFGDIRDEMDDELRILIHSGKTSAYCTFSSAIKPAAQFVRVYGDKSTAHADFISRSVIVDKGPSFPSAIGRVLEASAIGRQYRREGRRNLKKFMKSDFHYFSGLNTLISRFYDCIINDSAPPIPYEAILKVNWMMREIFLQIESENERERN